MMVSVLLQSILTILLSTLKCDQASDRWQQIELASKLESGLWDTLGWRKKWLVDFNAGKTQLVLFNRCHNTGVIDVKSDGFVLEGQTSAKMLGLFFSSKLNWGSYIFSIAKLLARKLELSFALWSFFFLRFLFICINLQYSCAWNTIAMFRLVLLAHSSSRVPNPPILWGPLYISYTPLLLKFCPTPTPSPTLFFCYFFSLTECKLLNDVMDLTLLCLGPLVPGARCCLFYALRHQMYLQYNFTRMTWFLLVPWFHFTHRDKHTQDTQGPKDCHTYKYILTPLVRTTTTLFCNEWILSWNKKLQRFTISLLFKNYSLVEIISLPIRSKGIPIQII